MTNFTVINLSGCIDGDTQQDAHLTILVCFKLLFQHPMSNDTILHKFRGSRL